MKKILFIFSFLLCITHLANAQRIDYDKTSNFYWGFNIGHTWHTSDVNNIKDRFPMGAGLILGGTMNQDYGKLFTYDLRVRYLGGVWYGHDTDTTSFGKGNYGFKPAFDSLGYALKNFRSVQHSLDLELSIHFNRLKERSGVDPYIFAGIGYVGTRTKGNIYVTKDVSAKSLTYDTPLDKDETGELYDKRELRTQLLPSLGVGIGYFFNSRFSLGIEHRSTFFRGDYFDGTPIDLNGQPSKIENDIYHYTSVYFKWYFKPREERKERERTPITPPVYNTNESQREPERVVPPTVNFTNPATSGTVTNSQNYTIRADVQHVTSSSNLMFRQNNRIISSFVFNPHTGVFESDVLLQPGENTFYLYGTNNAGNDSDETIIIYRENQRLLPPIVNIVDPAASPHTVNSLNYIVKASIQNISSRNQLTVVFNDKLFNDYSFTSGTSINFTANLNLSAGINTLKITGTNDAGTDSDETIIIYTRQPTSSTGYPPKVDITTPSVSPYSTTKQIETVIAQVENVSSKSEINVMVNGVSTTNFNYNNTTKTVVLNAHLLSGSNTVRIVATNSYGSDMDETHFTSTRSPQAPPVVNIVTPSIRPYTATQDVVGIEASVENISEKHQLEVKVNGNVIDNFYFSPVLKSIQFDAQLIPGNNQVYIKGTNPYGSSYDEIQIIFNRAPSPTPPTVEIVSPVSNPHSSSKNSEIVIANTNHITSKSQVEVKINGQSTQNFTFNTTTKQVRFNANLSSGSNIVSIKVSNGFGTDTDERQILYRTPVVQNPPKVKIFTPADNPHTTSNNKETVLASTSYIDSKSQVEVKVNGVVTNDFTFTASKQIELNTQLSIGNNLVSIKVVNEYGMGEDERLIVYDRSSAKTPPTVTITQPTSSPHATRKRIERIIAKTTHISNKSQIEVRVNNVVTDQFTFDGSTQTIELDATLKSGSNSVRIVVTNTDGSDSAETLITHLATTRVPGNVNVANLPCLEKDYPSLEVLTPKNTTTTIHFKDVEVKAVLKNITSRDEITVYFNGQKRESFSFNETTFLFSDELELNEGTNKYQIVLDNDCKTVDHELFFTYQPLNCGLPMDLTDDGQVCIITENTTITNAHLINNSGLVYDGSATHLYFKAKEHGTVIVNNQPFQVVKGNFYYFQGNLSINLRQENNEWIICVESQNPPLYGTGRSKPANPCSGQNNAPIKDSTPLELPNEDVKTRSPRLTKPGNMENESPQENRRPVRNR